MVVDTVVDVDGAKIANVTVSVAGPLRPKLKNVFPSPRHGMQRDDTRTSMASRDKRYGRTIVARNCVRKEPLFPKAFPLPLPGFRHM